MSNTSFLLKLDATWHIADLLDNLEGCKRKGILRKNGGRGRLVTD